MIEIKKEYGKFNVILPNSETLTFNNVEELLKTMEAKLDEFEQETVEISTYAFSESTIDEAMDLTLLATMLSWGRRLYVGDSIKLTIRAEYEPEDK